MARKFAGECSMPVDATSTLMSDRIMLSQTTAGGS